MPSNPSCPSESIFAELAAGKLVGAARVAFEQHLDQCADCTELLWLLAPPSSPQHRSLSALEFTPDSAAASWHTCDTVLAATMLAAQLAWTAILGWAVGHCVDTVPRIHEHWPLHWALGYVGVVGLSGLLVGGLSVLAMARGWKLASRLMLFQALMCFATLTMAPLAYVTIAQLRKQKS